MIKGLSALALAGLLSAGCTTTSYTSMEKHLNRYAGAEVVAVQCPAYGGYGSVAAMRADAEKNLAQAQKLGATEADIQKARGRLNSQLMGATVLVGSMQACSMLVNNLAWAGSQPATSDPVKPSQIAKK